MAHVVRRFFSGWLSGALTVFALAWSVVAAFAFLGQHSMIYHPLRAGREDQEVLAKTLGLEPWHGSDGVFHGWRTPRDQDAPTDVPRFVLFHGNAGYALHRADYIRLLRSHPETRHSAIYLLEYPGYGARDGRPSEHSFIEAASLALRSLAKESPGASFPLILFGESLGTGVACLVAGQAGELAGAQSVGLFLITPFDNIVSVGKHHFPWLPVGWLLRDRFDSSAHAPDFSGRVAIVVAANDEIVPAHLGKKLFQRFPEPKLLLEVPGARHNDVTLLMTSLQWRQAMEFLLSEPPGR